MKKTTFLFFMGFLFLLAGTAGCASLKKVSPFYHHVDGEYNVIISDSIPKISYQETNMSQFRYGTKRTTVKASSHVSAKSLTVPHQVYSLQELISRAQRGLPIHFNTYDRYDTDNGLEPDIDNPNPNFVTEFEVLDELREAQANASRKREAKADVTEPAKVKEAEADA